MSNEIEIVDLFAGPGGLGEGFSAAGRETTVPMSIRLSVEKDDFAIQTLRLRAFLRSFEGRFPAAYYDALNRSQTLPDWSETHGDNWKLALEEAQQMELGGDGVFEHLTPILDKIRERCGGRTVLIGGPPCQAYSVVGRARNAGKKGYVPESDGRHFLYREYVSILDRLKPAAFVMENVKGMLSSQVNGGPIFERVFEDLRLAGDGYALLPLTVEGNVLSDRKAGEFIVRAEEHGVPQARHRVFIVGLRLDLAKGRKFVGPLLVKTKPSAINSVVAAIGGMPRLRSGLSREDSPDAWENVVKGWARRLAADSSLPAALAPLFRRIVRASEPGTFPRATSAMASHVVGSELAAWLEDPMLEVSIQHETRGHIADDLGRYLYASAFAKTYGYSPKLHEFPSALQPDHANRATGAFADRFRVQLAELPSTTVTSHISKDGHYFIHPDPEQCRSLTVREAARLQTFPDNYHFCGPRTEQYKQVGNAVPCLLAKRIAHVVHDLITSGG
ncbi:DNA cytosine methyltransferase [Novosphingobium sp.]|uniref:DNA cytosine methyltransferase n=1 Tax=Novosphingobium sp. TaxID=1874826 RepID=UPI003B51FE3B